MTSADAPALVADCELGRVLPVPRPCLVDEPLGLTAEPLVGADAAALLSLFVHFLHIQSSNVS